MRKSRTIQRDNMVLLVPPDTKPDGTNHYKKNIELNSQTDFVFSSEKNVSQSLNIKFGSFKYHNPKCNDIILLENVEIENSPRFFTRDSFDELWKLYIFLHNNPAIQIKINGYPNKTDQYKDEEAIELTAHATQNVQKFLLFQNVEVERIPYEAANKIIEKRKLPFYNNQPFWIEIVIKKL